MMPSSTKNVPECTRSCGSVSMMKRMTLKMMSDARKFR
tara:strand:- start:257 stop:370 length:114 start_codon:yes stop_codon:yes gene_type:complete